MLRVTIVTLLLGSVALPALADTAAGEAALARGQYTTAVAEFRESAQEGDPAAQLRLGQLYAEGLGVPQNFTEAHKWYNIAASAGSTAAAQARDRLAERMTQNQIARAQQAAAAFEPEAAEAEQAVPGYSVSALQRALNAAGFDAGAPDGVVGARTREAIRSYQRAAGLPVTGVPSPALYSHLIQAPAGTTAGMATTTPTQGQLSANEIAEIQAELRQRGYEVPVVNGQLDVATRQAIRNYQRDAGLTPTGRPDEAVLASLRYGDDVEAPAERRELVTQVQRALNELGYDAGPPNGTLGPRTRTAIRTFQADAGLMPTGDINPQLLSRLQAQAETEVPTEEVPAIARPATPASPEDAVGQIIQGIGEEVIRSLGDQSEQGQ